MQQIGVARPAVPWLARFAGKFVLDILPAALASVIGGFLFTQYHFAQANQVRPAAEQGAPASAEMLAMVRDEHAEIMNYLKAQTAAEQSRYRQEDAAAARAAAAAKTAADAKLAGALATAQAVARHAAAPVVKQAARPKPIVVAAVAQAPLVIAQAGAGPNEVAVVAVPPARDSDSLLARTLDIKDHVVDATRHVVSVIGSVFGALGDSIGNAVSGPRQFRSS